MGTNLDARIVDDPRTVVTVDEILPNLVTVLLGQALSTGANILPGTGDPVTATGLEGDFYVDTASGTLWGPKGAVTWPVSAMGTFLPAASATYTPTNVSTDRSFDADSTTLAELADVVGTIIADLQASGLIL
jgi:hypothetical protein